MKKHEYRHFIVDAISALGEGLVGSNKKEMIGIVYDYIMSNNKIPIDLYI